MEVELGLKITKTVEQITFISDFQFAKDRAGPLFLSKETDTKFILYAQLRGYKKENIDIKISEDGSEIWVSGEKAVQEMTMIPLKKDELIKRGFKKKFKIPEKVVLDGIKASYNEEESELTIVMPKMVKGMTGVRKEEVKKEEEEEEVEEKGRHEDVKLSDEVQEKDKSQEIKKERPRRRPWKPCPPLLLGGSTLLVTLLFLVIEYIRMKKK
ncbi:17.6 kDa class I heat shock protein 1 [Senna tora]|uniref:17.6 kDa class I heat shock protein 1 n=1 Tax=Senna tora TaxID=362788 RepID=A0A834TJ98_9FABA|nr:17.6 kDa class I heat shock protein 1 [Senna tora]